MGLDALKMHWSAGNTALGAWLTLREPVAAEAAALSGYDYVCVDMQHGLADDADALNMIQAVARTAATPLVRVAFNQPWLIGRALDAGALGVIVPMVNSAAEAAEAVAACRYAPVGSRSIGPMVPGNRHGGRSYVLSANDAVACIVMIETRQALEQIDEIVAVPGVDAVYVGPADLSMSLGLAPAADNPESVFQDALATVVAACQRQGVIPGVHASAELAERRHAAGFRMITVGFDALAMFAALRADLGMSRATTITPTSTHEASSS